MSFILNFIIGEIKDRVTSWQTTIPSAMITVVNAFLTAFIDPIYLHQYGMQICQWLLTGLSLVLLAWKDRKQDYTPTPPPEKDNQ